METSHEKTQHRETITDSIQMAKKKLKLGKFFVVISLTILIWVWADRAKTETLPVTTGVIKINESSDPKLWITFNNKKSFNIESS